jgi:hypothetical protein
MRTTRLVPQALVAGTAALLLALTGAGAAQASGVSYSGNASYRATEMHRLANCAATRWYNESKQGGAISDCTGAGSDPYWDGMHLSAATALEIRFTRVGYAGGACPRLSGFAYIKCFYVGGHGTGKPVMTVGAESYGSGGMVAAVTWYYQ